MEQAAGTALQGAEGPSREGGHSKHSSLPPRLGNEGQARNRSVLEEKGVSIEGRKAVGQVFRGQGTGQWGRGADREGG